MNQPTLVRAEQALVAWGSNEKVEKYKAEHKLTQMHHILNEKVPGGLSGIVAQGVAQIRNLGFGDG
jgi:hypothetical protein